MARLVGADCGANLMERSYVLNGAGFTLVAKSNAIGMPLNKPCALPFPRNPFDILEACAPILPGLTRWNGMSV
jgi:hypothetical protein